MSDYKATPVEPIVQGFVTFTGPAGAPVFTGKGISAIARSVGHVAGAVILTLDRGLPGNAGAVQPLPEGAIAPTFPDIRTLVTLRGSGTPPLTTITTIGVGYLTSGVPGVGTTQIELSFSTVAPALADPAGFEIEVFENSDVAAAPTQPIVQGLLTVEGVTPSFYGRGVLGVVRNGAGDFTLTLDPGTPGCVGIDPDFARTMVTVRGVGTLPCTTTISEKNVTYPLSATPGVGCNQVRIRLASSANAGIDPTGADADGVEVIVWRGNAGPSNFSQQIVGPLFP